MHFLVCMSKNIGIRASFLGATYLSLTVVKFLKFMDFKARRDY